MALRAETGFDHGQELSNLADIAEAERVERIRRATAAYYGEGSDPLKVKPGQVNDNVRVPLARLIVDTGASYLLGSGVRFGDEESLIRPLIRPAGGQALLSRIFTSGAIGGTAFVKLTEGRDKRVRFSVLSPDSVEILWDPADVDDVIGYIIRWLEQRAETTIACRQRVILNDGGRWEVITEESVEGETWRVVDSEVWPWSWSPVHHCQNLPIPHEAYGESDLPPEIVRLCSTIERSASNLSRLVRIYAHPRLYGKMIGNATDFDANPGALLLLEHPDAAIESVDVKADLANSLNVYRSQLEALYTTTRVPEVATGKAEGSLSALAVKIRFAPLIQKTESKRLTYGPMIEDLIAHATEMIGQPIPDPTVVWPDIVPADEEAEARTALLMSQVGISKASIVEMLGFDPEEEAQRRDDDRAEGQAAFDAGVFAPSEPDVAVDED